MERIFEEINGPRLPKFEERNGYAYSFKNFNIVGIKILMDLCNNKFIAFTYK